MKQHHNHAFVRVTPDPEEPGKFLLKVIVNGRTTAFPGLDYIKVLENQVLSIELGREREVDNV